MLRYWTCWLLSCCLIVTSVFSGITPAIGAEKHAVENTGTEESREENAVDSLESEDANPNTALAPGFLIQVSSKQDQRLNGNFRIQSGGSLLLPYGVSISTKGMTLGQFRARFAKIYRPYFNGEPRFHVGIRQKRYWVEMHGLVERPGSYLLKRDTPLDELIAQAGGLTTDPTARFVRVEQQHGTKWVNLDEYFKQGKSSDVPSWGGGDRLFFQTERPELRSETTSAEAEPVVQMVGEVRTPGTLAYRKGADGYHYLLKTGGPTEFADLDRVEVVRADVNGVRSRASIGPISDVRSLQERDIVIVHPSRPTPTDHFFTTASAVTSIVTAVVLTGLAIKVTR